MLQIRSAVVMKWSSLNIWSRDRARSSRRKKISEHALNFNVDHSNVDTSVYKTFSTISIESVLVKCWSILQNNIRKRCSATYNDSRIGILELLGLVDRSIFVVQDREGKKRKSSCFSFPVLYFCDLQKKEDIECVRNRFLEEEQSMQRFMTIADVIVLLRVGGERMVKSRERQMWVAVKQSREEYVFLFCGLESNEEWGEIYV